LSPRLSTHATWDCGTPLGIDVPAAATDCPAAQPTNGSACSMPEREPSGNRPGCFFDVAMTTTHDCSCEHYLDGHAIWDCGLRSGDGPVDSKGCPARQPLDSTLCNQAASVACQYGYNLSTTCRCHGGTPSQTTWSCETVAQPPSPSEAK
jgi:hypothetical protein